MCAQRRQSRVCTAAGERLPEGALAPEAGVEGCIAAHAYGRCAHRCRYADGGPAPCATQHRRRRPWRSDKSRSPPLAPLAKNSSTPACWFVQSYVLFCPLAGLARAIDLADLAPQLCPLQFPPLRVLRPTPCSMPAGATSENVRPKRIGALEVLKNSLSLAVGGAPTRSLRPPVCAAGTRPLRPHPGLHCAGQVQS
jgi:hypothetical protein